jgi:hypothetical protein
MPEQEKSFVKKLFQTKKARLLYFIYRRRKIRNDSGVKAKLKRVFNYKSDGHLYHDLDLLKNSGLIEEKNGYLAISKSGRAEFQLLEILRLTTFLSVGYGGYILFGAIFMYNWLPINFQIPLYSVAVVLFAIAILCYYTFRTFRPLPPDPSEEIE